MDIKDQYELFVCDIASAWESVMSADDRADYTPEAWVEGISVAEGCSRDLASRIADRIGNLIVGE